MTDITGRDGDIQAKALVYGIAAIQALPREKQEWSDMNDMRTLARAWVDAESLALIAHGVERHMGVNVDMFVGETVKTSIEYDLQYKAALQKLRDGFAEIASEARYPANLDGLRSYGNDRHARDTGTTH